MSTLKKLNVLSLTLLITGAIDSIRNLPGAALFGSALIFFFIFSAIFFLIPTALVSAELSANIEEGGIYNWCRLAFGNRIGFLAVWFQWVNNLFWFPTILSFIAGTASYFFDPQLAQNKIYLVSVILSVFWGLTYLNLKGVKVSSKFTSLCAFFGFVLPICFIMILFGIWVFLGNPIQIHFTMASLLPNLNHIDNWIGLTVIMMGYSGMELATVHIKDVNNPQSTFPKALAISTVIILITMMLGSLAIACVLPADKINLVNGTIETFTYFLTAYHLHWLLPILVLSLVIGNLGGVISWVVSPIKGLAQAASNGYMPPSFGQENNKGAPKKLLILQAMLVSVVCLAFLFFPSVNASYWLLTALSTQMYMFMYVLMFAAGLVLRKRIPYNAQVFNIPGKKWGSRMVGILGLMGCAITIYVGFIPPSNMNIGSKLTYELIFCGGILGMTLPILFFYWYEARNAKLLSLELEATKAA